MYIYTWHPNRLAPLSISSGQVAEKALEISGLALEFFPEAPGHGGVSMAMGAAPIAGWFVRDNPMEKRMIYIGVPRFDLGHLHIFFINFFERSEFPENGHVKTAAGTEGRQRIGQGPS